MYAYIYTYYITPLGFHFNAKVDTNYQGHWIPPHLFVAQMRTPPHSSQLIYLPKSSLSIGLDKDKLNVPPRFSLRYYAVMGIRLGPMRTYYNRGSVYTFTLLVLESILAIDIVPHCTQLCLYESTIYAEVSVVSHAGGTNARFPSRNDSSRLP